MALGANKTARHYVNINYNSHFTQLSFVYFPRLQSTFRWQCRQTGANGQKLKTFFCSGYTMSEQSPSPLLDQTASANIPKAELQPLPSANTRDDAATVTEPDILDDTGETIVENDSGQAKWLTWLCALALLLMANQIKLPVAGGRLGVADLGFAAALLGLFYHLWRNKQRVFFPALAFLTVCAFAFSNLFARSGMGGAMEVAHLAQQLFCGWLILSYLVEHSPRLALGATSLGLAVNLLLAAWQTKVYGYGAILPPADVLKISWGFGEAYTGFFRSRMAISFFLGAALTWAQPQWLGRNPGPWRCILVGLATLATLFGIAHAQILAITIIVLLLGAALQSRRALVVNLITIVILLTLGTTWFATQYSPTIKTTFSALKNNPYPSELKTNHLDFIAAGRMAQRVPWFGVGSGRYQENIGRCYGDLPNPIFNDIDTDTQAGWGIMAATAGFPTTVLFIILMLAAVGGGAKRYFQSRQQNTLALGGSLALLVFMAGMTLSNPMTRGLGWFLVLALGSASLPNRNEDLSWIARHGIKSLLAGGAALGLLLVAVAALKATPDPLAVVRQAEPRQRRPAVTEIVTTEGEETAVIAAAPDFFKIIDANEVKEMSKPFEKVTNSLAANQSALQILDGKGVPPEGKEPAMEYGGAVFEFEVPADLECKVWLRVWWNDSCGNTINLQMDDEARSVTIGNDSTYTTWHWMEAPKTYKLKAGKHTVTLLNREDGIMFDQMLITNDHAYYPQGIEEE